VRGSYRRKKQKQMSSTLSDSSQNADHDYQFHNIGFLDDISIFAETPEGIQILLDVVQEFTRWCGMEINVKKLSCSSLTRIKSEGKALRHQI